MGLKQVLWFQLLCGVGLVVGQLRGDEVFEAYPPGQYVAQQQLHQPQILTTKNGQLLRAYPASGGGGGVPKRLRLVPVSPEGQAGVYGVAPPGQFVGRPIPSVRPQATPAGLPRLKGGQPVPLQGVEYAKEQEAEEEYPSDPNPQYNFSFDVKDDELTNYQNRQEERDGEVIKGSYSVVDPDGYVRTVTYTADAKNGFQAKVVREPTDVKIKFPVVTPPPDEEKVVKPLKTKLRAYPHLGDQQLAYRQPVYQLQPNQ